MIDTAVVELVAVLMVDTVVGIEVDTAEADCSMLSVVLEEEHIAVVLEGEHIAVVMVHMYFLVADMVVDKLVVLLD